MDTKERREKILELLHGREKPMSASSLAQTLNVSRQIIVGDVALLRATGNRIVSTARGYLLEDSKGENSGIYEVLCCKHEAKDTKKELYIMIDHGGEVMNTTIEHPVYGAITADLKLSYRYEVDEFLKKQKEYNARLISEITNGYHTHTIRCQSKDQVERIKEQLKKQGFLQEDE